MLYDYMKTHEIIDAEIIGNQSLIGNWKFVPEKIAGKVLEEDVKLLFGDR
jgi:hypothetical protein